MSMYSVHIRDKGEPATPEAVFVPDRFSVAAMIFGFLWALWIGAWDVAIILFAVQVGAGALIPLVISGEAQQGFAQLGVAVIIGFTAFELRRVTLSLHGFREVDVVGGPTPEEAERRYFDTHPTLTARMLGHGSIVGPRMTTGAGA